MEQVLICLDGCSPEYLTGVETNNLLQLGRSGWAGTVKAVIPSVTNVNNTSLITGEFPNVHGITGNYHIERDTGQGHFMETSNFLLTPTALQRISKAGGKSALLTTKDKLASLLGQGATISASAENAPGWLVDSLGPAPGIYSGEINLWLLDAAIHTLTRYADLQLVYVATSDYVMHKYGPDEDQARSYVVELDRRIGRLMDRFSGSIELVVTADHGMNRKTNGIDLEKLLLAHRIQSNVVPIIKDRYVAHHQNLGGAAYVYLGVDGSEQEAAALLSEQHGVEAVLERKEAAERFQLHPGRIGDLMVLGDKDTVFGFLSETRVDVQVRSHGSTHELQVPLIASRSELGAGLEYGKDAVNRLIAGIVAP